MAKSTSPNSQRSDVKNPNNPAYSGDRANRIEQGHANVPPPPAPHGTPTTVSTEPKK